MKNARPDLVSTELAEADSSHPSEHNIRFVDPDDPAFKKQSQQREAHAQRCRTSAKKAATKDAWRALQAERGGQHREAFSDPKYGTYYPYWGVSMGYPYGYVIDAIVTLWD